MTNNINYSEPNTITKAIRDYLKGNFPACKFSVTKRNFNVITVALMEAPFEAFTDEAKQNAADNAGLIGCGQYREKDLTSEASEVMCAVTAFVKSINYDDSDYYTDYFDRGFYDHIYIGKWNKPFKSTAVSAPAKAQEKTAEETAKAWEKWEKWESHIEECKKQLEEKAAEEEAAAAVEIESRFSSLEIGAKLSNNSTIVDVELDENGKTEYIYATNSNCNDKYYVRCADKHLACYDVEDFLNGDIAFEEISEPEQLEQPDENQITFDEIAAYSANDTATLTAPTSPIDETAARLGHEAYCTSDYKAGSATAEYNAAVADVRAAADEVRGRIPEEYHGELDSLVNRYAVKLADWTNRKNRVDASCPSWFITGAANYPHKKHEKQMQRLDKLFKEYDTIAALENRIKNFAYECKHRPIKAGDASAVEKIRSKVEELTALQNKMKQCNVEASRRGEAVPYAAWALSNNRQNLKRYADRLAVLEKAKSAPTETTDHIEGEGFRVVRNTEIMRLQFLFDGKPDEQIRALLKSNGFKWAPSQMAWQRQLTANAERVARTVAEAIQ